MESTEPTGPADLLQKATQSLAALEWLVASGGAGSAGADAGRGRARGHLR